MSRRDWALVTGGSRNIGEAIARRLKADGFSMMVSSRTPPEHDDYDEFVKADFADPDAAAAAIREAVGDRPFTRFVHNAAVSNIDAADAVSVAEMQRLYAINTTAMVAITQVLLPAMRRERVGRIVAIGSRAGLGKIKRVAYAGSKSALSGVVRTMALEFGGEGITVNAVAPGPVETSMFRASTLPGSLDYKNLNDGIPVGFIGDPADIAHAVSYFTSDGARFCTGQLIFVCGGTSVAFVDGSGRTEHKFVGSFPQEGQA